MLARFSSSLILSCRICRCTTLLKLFFGSLPPIIRVRTWNTSQMDCEEIWFTSSFSCNGVFMRVTLIGRELKNEIRRILTLHGFYRFTEKQDEEALSHFPFPFHTKIQVKFAFFFSKCNLLLDFFSTNRYILNRIFVSRSRVSYQTYRYSIIKIIVFD